MDIGLPGAGDDISIINNTLQYGEKSVELAPATLACLKILRANPNTLSIGELADWLSSPDHLVTNSAVVQRVLKLRNALKTLGIGDRLVTIEGGYKWHQGGIAVSQVRQPDTNISRVLDTNLPRVPKPKVKRFCPGRSSGCPSSPKARKKMRRKTFASVIAGNYSSGNRS